MKTKSFKNILLIFIFLPVLSFGQIIKTKLDIVGGASAREYFHGGLRYQYTDITQLGIYYGGDIGVYSEIIRSYAIDNMVHFGKHSFYANRPVWYARQGFTYVTSKDVDETRKFSYINIALGRDFAINDWLGFNADFGIIAQLKEKIEKDNSTDTENKKRIQWMPLIRVQFYISL